MISQLPLTLNYAPRYDDADFIVTAASSPARGWIERWPDWPAPLSVLLGPEGAGKTHLGHIWAARADARWLKPEEMHPGQALGHHLGAPGSRFVIDDADRVLQSSEAQETLFHLYNQAKEAGGSILLLTRTPPSSWDYAYRDLASRLKAAPVIAIAQPDDDLIPPLLQKLFAERGLKVGPEILDYLALHLPRGYAALGAAVEAIDRAALDAARHITLPLVRGVVASSETASGEAD